VYGLIGQSLGHSHSPTYFLDRFEQAGIHDAAYRIFEFEDVAEWRSLVASEGRLAGANVTTPYKRSIVPFLDALTEEAAAVGAVNVILRKGDKWVGDNTDAEGFSRSIRPFFKGRHERALVLGSGGAAAAVRIALERLGVKVVHVVRKAVEESETGGGVQVRYDELGKAAVAAHKLIVQCTPVGTAGRTGSAAQAGSAELPPLKLEGIGKDHLVIDLVYNPVETPFLREARARGAETLGGSDMLRFQAEATWKRWGLGDVTLQA
jgi:shikimate dehydrogenase